MKTIHQFIFTMALAAIFPTYFVNAQAKISPPASANSVSDYSLLIENEDGKQTKLSLAEVSKLPRQSVKVKDHEKEAVFEGFALSEVLKLAGVEFGKKLRGKRLANFLLVEAADKYQVVFALAELDPAFSDKTILLADKRDGQPLSRQEGVWRIIVPDEKKQGRWVRQVTNFRVISAATK